jgi:hypothetical protein
MTIYRNVVIASLWGLLFFVSSCDKERQFSGTVVLTGNVQLVDTAEFATALPGLTVYLNSGSDTTSYEWQTQCDSTGKFTIPSLDQNTPYVVFTQYSKNGLIYSGAFKFKTGGSNTFNVSLDIYPVVYNELMLSFVDSVKGLIPNLPFRVYSSRTAATVDSIKYAVLSAHSNSNGYYYQYNFTPGYYYIVAHDTLNGVSRAAFDSLNVGKSGNAPLQVVLK